METDADKAKKIVRHIEHVEFTATLCNIHTRKCCFLIHNNFNENRYHCLFAKSSTLWKSITSSPSCDLPEHVYEMIEMHKLLGSEYVLPFARSFRERTGYTIAMFYQPINLYSPRKITHATLKETAYAFIFFFCIACQRLGGNVPDLRKFLFLFTAYHPVLCDLGKHNVETRVRLINNQPHLNEKKFRRVMQKKTIRDIIRYLKLEFQLFFNQKKKKGKRCILNETEDCFDTETHQLLCQSQQKSLVQVLKEFDHLMPNNNIRENIIGEWIQTLIPPAEDEYFYF